MAKRDPLPDVIQAPEVCDGFGIAAIYMAPKTKEAETVPSGNTQVYPEQVAEASREDVESTVNESFEKVSTELEEAEMQGEASIGSYLYRTSSS